MEYNTTRNHPVMVTFSGVSSTALIICKASFFAPCGVIVPESFLPPVTSNAFMLCACWMLDNLQLPTSNYL